MLNDDITALIDSISIPVITGALRCADEFFLTAAAQRNRNHVGDKVCFAKIYLSQWRRCSSIRRPPEDCCLR